MRQGSAPQVREPRRSRGTAIAVGATVLLVTAALVWTYRPESPLPAGTEADLLVVNKSARRMLVYAHGSLLRSYRVSLGHDPLGPKRRQGDHRTPEGRYVIDHHNPNSAYHLSLHVSYPSAADAARARASGYSPGGEIMIHGTRNGLGWLARVRLPVDWTDGCIAVTNAEMDELYRVVPDGTPIEIRP